MVKSFLNLAVACAPFAVCGVPAAQEESAPVAISHEADSFTFDRKTNTVTYEGFRLTYGDLTLQADRAVITGGLGSDGQSQFTGDVRIMADAALFEADSATFTFEDGELARVEIVGDPARFTDMGAEREQQAEGGANVLAYDYASQTLRLADGAWLRVGQNEIRGCDLIYDFAEGRAMSGSSSCAERFSITIVPQADEAESDTDRSP